MSREATNRLLEMVEDGALDRDTVIMACVKYMSEDDVADMCRANEFFTCSECGGITDGGDLCEECQPEEDEEPDYPPGHEPGTACGPSCGHCGGCS